MAKKIHLELDRFNIILCLIVVFIHAFGQFPSLLLETSLAHFISTILLRACAFAVQGFIFLSALKYSIGLSDKNGSFNYFSFLLKRIKKVVIPYIISVLAYYLVFIAIGNYDSFNLNEFAKFLLTGSVSAHFYFVIAILQFYLLMPLWILMRKYVNSYFAIILSLVIFVVWIFQYNNFADYFDKIFLTYLPYWVLGMVFGKHYSTFKNKLETNFGKIIIAFSLLVLIDSCGHYFFNAMLSAYVFELIHMLYCISAIIMFVNVCICFKDKKLSLISGDINSLSYEIYLWHCLVLVILNKFIDDLALPSLAKLALFRIGGIYSIIIVLSIIIYIIKKLFKKSRTNNIGRRRKL